ncbi:MAG: 7-cyano-7-deazaguanine synthase [Candidatus Helarchaeota archaeon]
MESNENYWKRLLNYYGKTYNSNIQDIKHILIKNRGYVYEPPNGETVIILFSGGMDSTVLIDLVVKNWKCKIILLHFLRDAKNQQWENQAVDYFYNYYKNKFPKYLLELIKLKVQIPSRVNKEYMNKVRQKILGLPMRNSTMWNNAIAQAVYLSSKYHTTIRTILAGSVKDDLDSPESGPLALLSQTLHSCLCTATWNLQIWAPLTDDSFKNSGFSKLDLIKHAKNENIPIEKTRSCFGNQEEPCGECLACLNRDKAFQEFRKSS